MWPAHTLGGALCRHHAQYAVFVPPTSEMAVGLWRLYLTVCDFLWLHKPQLFLVPYSFFVFCYRRSPLSRCKQVKCPRSQAVLVIVMVFVDIFTMYKSRSGFPNNPVGIDSICNAGDPSSIPGSGRSTGEGIGYDSSILGLLWWLSW